DLVREAGDLVIAAFFSYDKDRARTHKRDELLGRFTDALRDPAISLSDEVKVLGESRFAVKPFHWEIEFPEVFDREDTGFDAIIGNPPFIGGMLISTEFGNEYKDWLYGAFPESGDRMDLVAYFFRRAFVVLRQGGTLGLIATNTIAQGDTRKGGLRYVCQNGGTIYAARRRLKWPGQAAVVVSLVHIANGKASPPYQLDGKDVRFISAYLFQAGGHDNPLVLSANQGKCFIGTNVLGMGFTFDDTDSNGPASPLKTMRSLIESDKRNARRIFPFIGGEEVNVHPIHEPHRYIINFDDFPLRRADLGQSWMKADERERRKLRASGVVPIDYPEPVAADWPDLLRIVEERVRPERANKLGSYSKQWWLFGRRSQEGQQATSGLERILVNCQVSPHLAFAFLPSG